MGINPLAAARKEAQRQTYIDEERKLVELGEKRKDAARKAASENKEKDLIGARNAETESVFDKIGRDYVENSRRQKEKEKEEEKRWEGFGDIFANPESTVTKNQANRFSQGTQSKTAEESKQSHYKNTGLRFGVDEDYLDKMIAEAEQKKGKDLFSEAMENSVANSVANITGTADFLIGKPLQSLGWEDNFISEWNSYYQDKAEEKHQDVMEAAARTGKGRTAEIAREILTFLGEAGIDAALSAFTGGALAAAKLGSKGGKVLKYADDVGDLAKLDFDDVSDVQKGLQDIPQKRTIKERLDNGEIHINICLGAQKSHMEGTKEYLDYYKARLNKGKTPQSILTIDKTTAQDIINKYAGTGVPKIPKGNEPIKTEYVTVDFVVGKYYKNNKYYPTKKLAIHYSKRGTHIVPVKPKEN